MERNKNNPHYYHAVLSTKDKAHMHDGEYQRVVFEENDGPHRKHIKYLEPRLVIEKDIHHSLRQTSCNTRFCPHHTTSSKTRRHLNEGVKNLHKPMVSSSQLTVEVSELHTALNGRLEITCLATIPAHVGPGEQFADYKTLSVKSK